MKRNEIYAKVVEFESKPLSIEGLKDGEKLIFEIYMVKDEFVLSETEKGDLIRRIDKKVRDAFHELEPKFDDVTLSGIIRTIHANNMSLLKDIAIVDGAVFVTEDMLNYRGEILYTKTTLYTLAPQFSYRTILDNVNNYRLDCISNGCEDHIDAMVQHRDVVNDLIRFVVAEINELMKSIKPETALYSRDYGHLVLIENGIPNVAIYTNLPLYKVYLSYVNKTPLEGKIIVSKGNNFYEFKVVQQFIDNVLTWVITEQKDLEVWRLSERVKTNELNGSAYQAKPEGK